MIKNKIRITFTAKVAKGEANVNKRKGKRNGKRITTVRSWWSKPFLLKRCNIVTRGSGKINPEV